MKNVTNKEIVPNEIIKTKASSLDVEEHENDIINAYRHKTQKENINIEFTLLNKIES